MISEIENQLQGSCKQVKMAQTESGINFVGLTETWRGTDVVGGRSHG